ncbi:MAG TPA: multicopper oxidase domain-containing protein [Vicinamibacterales bacterium]|nr:multicopper oxidase domain-containing protein [Vicinamibacterales bacterium]
MKRSGWLLLGVLLSLLPSGVPTDAAHPSRTMPSRHATGVTRTYYIAAEDVLWDYAPRGRNLTGAPSAEREDAASTPTTFRKVLYREYTDATFSTRATRPPAWQHLGLLGPLIRATVGDTVVVVFRNDSHIFCNMHPHGLAYTKASEGALYDDGTSGEAHADDLIAPGQSHTYVWTVPERAGPASGDPSSVLWMYHSHFVEPRDLNTGLLGPIIVTAAGAARPDGRPNDVDREFVTAFAIFDETRSAYFDANLARSPAPAALKRTDPAFRERFLMYTINGFIDGNLPLLTMTRGERVRWYLMANDNEEDVHAAHWHGQTATINNMRADTVPIGPMGMMVADMVPDNPGTWLFHCHVNEHFERGMQALFRVLP